MIELADVKISELEKMSGIAKSNLSKQLKNSEGVIKKNNRVVGVTPECVEEYMLSRGHDSLYHPGVYVVSSQVGGTAKTSSTIGLSLAYRRISNRKRPIVLIDTDSQASLTAQIFGDVADDDENVLTNFFEGHCGVSDLLTEIGDGIYVIKSSLANLYLDRTISSPKKIKEAGAKLIGGIFKHLGDESKIFIDTAPQLSAIGQSYFICMSSLPSKYDRKVLIPIRPDKTSIRGAKIAVREAKDVLSTFNLDEESIDIDVFITNYDQRVKVSVDTMRYVIEDATLSPHLCPILVRYSSEFSKSAFFNKNIFSSQNYKVNSATSDYMDLLLYVMGWEADIKGGK